MKPVNVKYLENAIKKASLRIKKNNESSFVFSVNGKKVILNERDILYFEHQKRKTIIHTLSDAYETYNSLNEILSKTHSWLFVRCHESLAVNFFHIKSYKFNEFLLDNGEILPISRKYKEEVSECFNIFASGERP